LVEFQNKIDCFLRLASDSPQFMRPAMANRFPTPVVQGAPDSYCTQSISTITYVCSIPKHRALICQIRTSKNDNLERFGTANYISTIHIRKGAWEQAPDNSKQATHKFQTSCKFSISCLKRLQKELRHN